MISHRPPTIPISSPAKCPNFSLLFLAVASPRTQSASLFNLHLRHRHRRLPLARRKKAAVAAPAVFLPRPDEDDEWRTSVSLSARDSGEPEANASLEGEILDFMLKSPNPSRLPTKKELIAAGRMDLVEAIAAHGSWLAGGWDLDSHADGDGGGGINGIASHSSLTNGGDGLFPDDGRIFQQRSSSSSVSDWQDSASSQSSSGRPIETEGGEDTGIEGILSRLKKERNFSYSVESAKKENRSWVSGKNGDTNQQHTSTDAVAGSKRNSGSVKEFLKSRDIRFQGGSFSYSSDTSSPNKPEAWRMWGAQRAGFPETEFEDHNSSRDVATSSDIHAIRKSLSECGDSRLTNNDKGNLQSQIHARIQQLQSELTSILHILSSGTDAIVSDKIERGLMEDLHKLSDAREFQQTAVMKTKDKLCSVHAQLAVLEGKMALEVIEAQKMVEERHKRVENAQKALNMFRTAYIIWPNYASEVFLVGSFDGWTSQRRMERSTLGIFSLNLKLYPGRYEIKFIVDGVWRIDPLRPVVNSSGYENNLLIIS